MIVLDGQIVGTWKATSKQEAVNITPKLFRALTAVENQALALAAQQYGTFLGLPATIQSEE
jgi:hypothetical protein